MSKRLKRRRKASALSPGTLVHIGEHKTDKVRITIVDYDETNFEMTEVSAVEETFPFRDTEAVTWINIDGVHEINNIEKIGRHFHLHPLILEDIVNTNQRPKMEDYGDYLYLVLKMILIDPTTKELQFEQVSLVLYHHAVISFQEKSGDVFDPIRNRIRNAKGHHRRFGADYLAYSLLDAVIDNYFAVLEGMGETIEDLEFELTENPHPAVLKSIHRLKRELILLRKSIWPLRELISGLQRTESKLIQNTTTVYLRDVYDHTIQVIDTVESLRDIITGMLDIYLSSVSNRMNEVMKVLTIIATIFIPMTFIAGVFGMNFHYMPELDWGWLYPAGFWMINLVIATGMVFYFKRKKWL